MCVCVCLCVCACVCVCVCVCIYMYICIDKLYICMYIRVNKFYKHTRKGATIPGKAFHINCSFSVK